MAITSERLTERFTAWSGAQLAKRIPYAKTNRFLEGPYAPVSVETTETELAVTGEVPSELAGLLTRIGPNPISVANPATYHWFLGDGMVHGLRMSGGKAVWYRNRYVQSDGVARALGRPKIAGQRRGVADAVNTNCIAVGTRLFALVEGGAFPIELDAELESVRQGLFQSGKSLPYTAHPHRDPATGKLHAISYDGLTNDRVYYSVVDADCRLERVVEIPVRDGPMIHDCAITATHVVIFDLPVTLSQRAFMAGTRFPYRWNSKHEARVGLLPFGGGAQDVRWFSVDPCYVFHACNAFDTAGGGATIDVVAHDSMFDRKTDGPDSDRITFERWTLDAANRTVRRDVRSEESQEFPRFDERFTGRPYRFGYTIGERGATTRLIRHDLATNRTIEHDYGAGRISSEAVFVPRSADASEDDGWLLSYVYDAATDRSDVVILNAADVAGEPAAVVHLPVRVPLGFHGNWVADAS